MKPHECDYDCESRRFWWYITYLCILVGCVGLALCHFLFNLAVRRKIKQDARDYYSSRPQVIPPNIQTNHFESIHDGIKISTDAMSDLVIEMTNGYSPHLTSITTEGYHNHRPLQRFPDQELNKMNKIVEVEVHTEKGLHLQSLQPYKNAVVTSPVTVAVATVSAAVAQQVSLQHQQLQQEGLENVSRPPSSPSYFDISDIVNSPENVRKASKSKTC